MKTKEQLARYAASQKASCHAKAIATGRDPLLIGRPPKVSKAEKLAKAKARQAEYRKSPEWRAKKLEYKKAWRLAKLLAKGGSPRKCYTPEERQTRYKAKIDKYRAANMDKIRIRDAELHKKQRAEKAIAEGREPGRIGRERVFTVEEQAVKKSEKVRLDRLANPEKYRLRSKAYHESNPGATTVRVRNRRARLKGAGGTHTKEDIKALFFEQKGLCGLCDMKLDADNFHVDHWKPLAKGGSNDKSNLKLLHPRCNLMKSTKDPMELRNKLISRSK